MDSSGSPTSGWGSYNGQTFGSSALPVVPSWEQVDTQTSPGVLFWGGRWLMYYDASQAGHAAGTGFNCLSVATTTTLTPSSPVFTDDSTQPLLCEPGLGGVVDPSPFVDPATGQAFLVWKSNDGGSAQPAYLWSQQLSSDGLSLVGSPHLMLTQDMVDFPFESTIENPDLAYADGTYFLLFSAGIWNSPSYSESYATCATPIGPCVQHQSPQCCRPTRGPPDRGAGPVPGPVGPLDDRLRRVAAGLHRLLVRWSSPAVRRSGHPQPTGLASPVTGMAPVPDGSGYWLVDARVRYPVTARRSVYGSMAGQHLNAPIDHIVATPDGRGYWLVAADGGIFTFGDAGFYGSMGGRHLNAPVVDIAPTPDGGGYWLVAADGGIFTFGDAAFHGSMGGQHLNRPVVGISADDATGGYWEVATDGGIFAFGAPFYGLHRQPASSTGR